MIQQLHNAARTSWLLLIMLMSSCASISLEKHNTKALDGLTQYWLTSSLYAEPSPQDNKLILLSFTPFSADRRGHIIPAGTLVQIQSFASADQAEHKHFRIFLRVALERGQVSIFNEKTHVLDIPAHITNQNELKNYLALFLSKQDPHEYLLKTRKYIQDAIWSKVPVIGMNKRELAAAMGPALKKQAQKNPDTHELQEVWYYPGYLVLLDKNLVSKVKKFSNQRKNNSLG